MTALLRLVGKRFEVLLPNLGCALLDSFH
jgi:hypothetical protein